MAELPLGTVTFLFSDIEGSTRLLTRLRGRYAEVLVAHQRLLRAAFAQHDGREVNTEGDAFFVAFARASDAIAAAVEGQRALAAHGWAAGAGVPRLAGRREFARARGDPSRRGGGTRGRLHRPGRPSCRANLRCRTRWARPDLAFHA